MAISTDPRTISRTALAAFARRHGVVRLALFGSAARAEMTPTSDVDVLIEMKPASRAGLFDQVRMAAELAGLFGRRVDLVTRAGLRPRVRATVDREAIVLFEA